MAWIITCYAFLLFTFSENSPGKPIFSTALLVSDIRLRYHTLLSLPIDVSTLSTLDSFLSSSSIASHAFPSSISDIFQCSADAILYDRTRRKMYALILLSSLWRTGLICSSVFRCLNTFSMQYFSRYVLTVPSALGLSAVESIANLPSALSSARSECRL